MKTSHRQNYIAAALVGALASTITPLVAQDGTNAVQATKLAESPERPPYRPWTIGIEAGTDGIFGGFASWRFTDHLGLRLGADWAEVSLGRVGIAGTRYDARLRLLSEPVVLDWYPWEKHSFHVGLGVMFNQNELTGTASVTGGSLDVKIEQQPVNPYLTLGGNLFYFDRAHRWALAGELGVAYTGEAKVSLTGSGSAGSDTQHRLQRYADQYKWWPVAKLAVTFSF